MWRNEGDSWAKGSITGQRTAGIVSSMVLEEDTKWRGLHEYELVFSFSKAQLYGKRILDLGCGPTAQLAQDLCGWADVVSLSPDFENLHYLESIPSDLETVNALGQSMPFQDAAFDRIFINHVTEWVDTAEYIQILAEAIRVLKPGGIIHANPIDEDFVDGIAESCVSDRVQVCIRDTGKTHRKYLWGEYKVRAKLCEVIIVKLY